MFRESLIETSHAGVVQRGWTTLMSFGMETAFLGLIMLTPLFFTQVMPVFQQVPAPPRMTSISPEDIRRAIRVFAGDSGGTQELTTPGSIPPVIDLSGSGHSRPAVSGPVGACEGCVYVRDLPNSLMDANAVIHNSPAAVSNPPVPPPAARETVIKRSQMLPSMLITRVEPEYPYLAKVARVQGEVLLAARIDREGRIVNLSVVRGHYLLVQAAYAAVSQWRYRPTILNGQSVEVDTQITVNFVLNQ